MQGITDHLIKTYLKHFIYEKCIAVLFDGIFNNFSASRNEEFKVGDKFEVIHMNSFTCHTMWDCTITRIIQRVVYVEHCNWSTYTGSYEVGKVNIEDIESYRRKCHD